MVGDMCEIGSVPLPNATWLTEAVALFQQSYGEVHPFIATILCAVGELFKKKVLKEEKIPLSYLETKLIRS